MVLPNDEESGESKGRKEKIVLKDKERKSDNYRAGELGKKQGTDCELKGLNEKNDCCVHSSK